MKAVMIQNHILFLLLLIFCINYAILQIFSYCKCLRNCFMMTPHSKLFLLYFIQIQTLVTRIYLVFQLFLVDYFDLGSFLVCLSISYILFSYLCFYCISIRYKHSSWKEEPKLRAIREFILHDFKTFLLAPMPFRSHLVV